MKNYQKRLVTAVVIICGMLCLTCCQQAREKVGTPKVEKKEAKEKPHAVLCTYYGRSTNGHLTASGERHNSDAYQCAHLTLPFGTRIRLRNPKNGKELVVKVNDRGPLDPKFTLDLTYGAARDLGFLSDGIAELEMTVVDMPQKTTSEENDSMKAESK